MLGRQGKQGIAVFGDQRLVGRDHMLATAHGTLNQRPRRIDAADQLHQHVHLGIVSDRHDVLADLDAGQLAGRIVASRADMHHFHGCLGTRGNFLRLLAQNVESAAANGTQAAQADANRFHYLLHALLTAPPGGRPVGTCA